MNLSRAIAGIIFSSSFSGAVSVRRSPKWLSIREIPVAAVRTAALSTDAASSPRPKRTYRKITKAPLKPEIEAGPLWSPPPTEGFKDRELLLSDLPRPSEVPFQPKVANVVHLVGTVSVPVQLQDLPDGSYVAVSVLVHEKTLDLPQFWIPVTFRGDLAQIAACHLKENDVVYVTGMLSGDAPLFTFKEAQTNIQVLAHSLSFVQKSGKGELPICNSDELSLNISESKEDSSTDDLWNDLFASPLKWWDNRSSKSNPNYAAFKNKDTGQLLWLNQSTPKWVLSKLEQLPISRRSQGSGGSKDNAEMSEKYVDKSWNDLVLNPQDWQDYRTDKLNKKVNPKFPDFKHKTTKKGLWLNSAPSWVSRKLEILLFNTKKMSSMREKSYDVTQSQQNEFGNSEKDSYKVKQKSSGVAIRKNDENSWKNLLENPSEWWDNRTNKFSKNSPDFKHKKTGEVLWLSSSTPEWVKLRLPPLDSENSSGRKATGRATLLS